MRQPGFFEGVVVALVAALFASIGHTALAPWCGDEWLIRLITAALGFGYIVYLLHRSRDRVGKVTTGLIWMILAGASWLLVSDLIIYLVVHLGMIWLVRSLYFHTGVLSAGADLVINALALMGGVWALDHSGSIFLGVWTLFLTQALFVFIRATVVTATQHVNNTDTHQADRFEQAYQDAEAAVRKLADLH